MTTDLMARALSAIPSYDALDAAKRAAAEARAETRNSLPAGGDLAAELADLLAAGKPLPQGLPERAHEAKTLAGQRRADLLSTLRATETELARRRDDAVTAGVSDALGVLASELAGIVDRARPALADLGHLDSPQAAIDHGAAEAWRTASDAADALVTLRQVQGRLITLSVVGSIPERDGGRATPRWGRRRLTPSAAVLTVGHLHDDDRPLEEFAVPDTGVPMLAALLGDGMPTLGVPGPDEIRTRAENLDRPAEPDPDPVVITPQHPYQVREGAPREMI